MRVRFNVNLGSIDAERIGVDFRQCQQGMEPEVSGDAGKWLVASGIAVEVGREIRGEAKAAAVQGIPPEPAKSKKAKDVAVNE